MTQLNLILLWHMHQPDYRDYATNEFVLPWVYLHAIKDYTDMAYHLEMHPRTKAIVNFVPVLLDQLEDYIQQFSAGPVRDPLLRLLSTPELDQISMQDRMIAPGNQEMMSKRMKPKGLIRLEASHASLASHPAEVVQLIHEAAKTV